MPGAGGKLLCVVTYALMVHVQGRTGQPWAPPAAHVCQTPQGCPAGHGATLGSDSYGCAHYSCTLCPAFTANQNAFGVCRYCDPDGFHYAPAGSAYCLTCLHPTMQVYPWSVGNWAPTECKPCPADKVRQNGDAVCTKCPDGRQLINYVCDTFTCGNNQMVSGNICIECLRGEHKKDDVCVQC